MALGNLPATFVVRIEEAKVFSRVPQLFLKNRDQLVQNIKRCINIAN